MHYSARTFLVAVLTVAVFLAPGCGRRVERAPIDSIPEETDNEVKISELEKMAIEYPDDENVYFALGNVYYEEAMPVEAQMSYEKALELNPKMNKARINMAMLLAETADPDTGLAILKQAIEMDDRDSKAYNNIGMIYYSKGDYNLSVKSYTKALEIDPDNVEARYNLGLAFAETGLLVEAVREWRKVLELDPEGEMGERTRVSLEKVERLLAE